MSRDANGRYNPGHCGNKKGRPPKQPRETSPQRVRDEFFEDADMPIPITENGKRKTIPARRAINRRLRQKALEGDMRAILEWKKTEYRYTCEFYDEQIKLLQELLETERYCKQAPEEVTEKLLEIMRSARAMLSPGMRS